MFNMLTTGSTAQVNDCWRCCRAQPATARNELGRRGPDEQREVDAQKKGKDSRDVEPGHKKVVGPKDKKN